MLIIRGAKKLRDRVKGGLASDGDASTTALGDWFANALFWRPQVALLVNSRTLLPVFMELAPAATLLERTPAAIEAVLRRHGVDEAFLAAECEAMREVRIAPTNDRSVVGVTRGSAHRSVCAQYRRLLSGPYFSRCLAFRACDLHPYGSADAGFVGGRRVEGSDRRRWNAGEGAPPGWRQVA